MEFINLAMQDHETFTQQASPKNESEATSRDNPIIPPGFNHVHLGKEKTGYDDFIVEVDGFWDRKTTRAGIGWAVKTNL